MHERPRRPYSKTRDMLKVAQIELRGMDSAKQAVIEKMINKLSQMQNVGRTNSLEILLAVSRKLEQERIVTRPVTKPPTSTS